MIEPSNTSRQGLDVHAIHKSFQLGSTTVEVLKGATFALTAGESLVLTGPSGSGKSTLLHIVGTLDTPTSGHVKIDGTDSGSLTEKQLARFRNRTIGFVFQDSHLLPQYSVLENVLLPALAFSTRAGNSTAWGKGASGTGRPLAPIASSARRALGRRAAASRGCQGADQSATTPAL